MLKHLFEDAQALLDAEAMTMYTIDSSRKNLNLAFSTMDAQSLKDAEKTIPIDQRSLAGIVAWTGHTMCLSKKQLSNLSRMGGMMMGHSQLLEDRYVVE